MHMNPVYKNELKMSARSMQIPVLAVIFNSILSVVTLSVLYSIRQGYIRNGSEPYSSMMLLYVVVLTIEVVLLCLFVPSAAGGSIAGERERQTLDILLSSRMSVGEIVMGKLLSCISTAVLLVFTSVPILAVTSMYGGMQLSVLYQSAAYVGFFILFIGSIGVFCSCRFKKTTYASISAYGVIIALTIGTGLLVVLLNMAVGGFYGNYFITSSTSELSYAYSSMVDTASSASASHPVAGIIYLWLLNPAVTYVLIVFHQIGEMSLVENFLHELGAADVVVSHWLFISLIFQAIFIIVMIVLATKYLNPQNERFKTGTKILKKHKTK
ncbi:ABC transporter permease [Coprococcus catus]|uniref:ABC transporter permease n=1 Tax=Coprococcus catus TaxID=116085 RepID=UPI001C8CCBF7|nr:ABC transporter permease subunit [Coprococcus catus]MBX9229924.1 ABC transporter permease subunit [Coprococcus catus]MCT6799015.1 ABC transporter permease subunit [Coprococcus catus]